MVKQMLMSFSEFRVYIVCKYKIMFRKCPELRGNWLDVQLLQISSDTARLRSFVVQSA